MERKTFTKYLSLVSFYILPILIILLLVSMKYLKIEQLELLKNFGDYAFKILIVILFISPLNSIFNYLDQKNYFKKKLLVKINLKLKFIFNYFITVRKQIGVVVFYFALFHSIGMIYLYKLYILQVWIEFDLITRMIMVTGIVSFIGMLILGLTSNFYSMRKLGRNWKKVQSLVYPTFFFVILHKYIIDFDLGPLLIGLSYLALKYIQHRIKKTYKN